jgi:hypothetical protein
VDNKYALAFWIKYHFIQGCLEEWSVKASYIRTEDQLSDILTKSVERVKFHELRARIGLVHNTSKLAHNT